MLYISRATQLSLSSSALFGAVISLVSCDLTRPNVSYDGCLAGVDPCPESCNGLDDDEDGSVDEGLTELCVVLNDLKINRSGIEGGFGRAIATLPDLDNDGYSELLVSATRPDSALTPEAPKEGEVSLISGGTQEIRWTVRSGGDFGFSLTAGAFDASEPGEWRWCVGAPTREERDGIGRVICLNFDGEVISRYSSEGIFGLGRYITKQRRADEGDWLIVTEPDWGEGSIDSDSDRRGRFLTLGLNGDEINVEKAVTGDAAAQRVSERITSTPDVSGDGVREWLVTAYSDAGRQVWLVDGTSDGEVSRIKRFSTGDETGDRFGDSLAAGFWSEEPTQPVLAIGAPRVSVTRDGEQLSVGRVYFTSGEGAPLGTNTAIITESESDGIGRAMKSVEVGEREFLIVAGGGLLRVISIEDEAPKVLEELTLPSGVSPTLAVAPAPEPNGEVRVWVGLPELEEVRLLTLRPPSAVMAE